MILSVDTSLGSAVGVVDDDGTVLSEQAADDPLGHAEVIGDLLLRALAEAGNPRITHVAAGMGPGPFTGLRIGIAAARTFALARGAVVVPVVSHDAIAASVLTADPAARFIVATDARRRELAWTSYDGRDTDGLPRRVTEPALVPRIAADETFAGWRVHEAAGLSGGALAVVAARAIASNRVLAAGEPLYLRSPDVAQPKARA